MGPEKPNKREQELHDKWLEGLQDGYARGIKKAAEIAGRYAGLQYMMPHRIAELILKELEP